MTKETHQPKTEAAPKPEVGSQPFYDATFSPKNAKGVEKLGGSARELITGVFRSAFDKIKDSRIAAKISAWHSKEIIQGVDHRMSDLNAQKARLEGKSADHSGAPGKIEQEYADLEKLAKERGIPLDPKLAKKLAQEKEEHLKQAEKYQSKIQKIDAQLGRLSEKRGRYENKREEAVGKICQKWESKIAGNNNERATEEDAISKIDSKLEEFSQNKTNLTSNISELENMLTGITSKELNAEIQKAISGQKTKLVRLEKEEKVFLKEKAGLEKSISGLEKSNRKLEKHVEKYKPKPRAQEEESQATAKRGADGSVADRVPTGMTLQDVLASVQASRERRQEQREEGIREIAQAIYDARLANKDNYSDAGITVQTTWDYVDNVLLKEKNLLPGSPEATKFMKDWDWEQAEKIYEAKIKQEEQDMEDLYEEQSETGLRRRLSEQMENRKRYGEFIETWNVYLSGKNRDLQLRNVPYYELDENLKPEEALEKIKNQLVKEKPQDQKRINAQAEGLRYLFQ